MKTVINIAMSAVMTLSSFTVYAEGRDGVGANTINGVMIEDYRVKNVSSGHPEFDGALQVLKELEKKSPYLAATLRENIFGLNWYIVPEKLDLLPSYKTGLSFNTDQSAFQTNREVYIDQNQFEVMVKKNTHTTLIIHEAVMAEVVKNKKAAATDADHARVRILTSAIMTGVSGEDLNVIIKENGFSASATSDVWNYVMVQSKGTGLGPSAVIAHKGARIFIYQCSAQATSLIVEKQIDSNMVVPLGLSHSLAYLVKESGQCSLASSSMYTVTNDFTRQVESHIANKIMESRNRVSGTALVGTVATATLLFFLFNKMAPEPMVVRVFANTIAGLLFGTLASFPTVAIGDSVGRNLGEKKMAKMTNAIYQVNLKGTTIMQADSVSEIQSSLIEGLEQMAAQGLILQSPIQK